MPLFFLGTREWRNRQTRTVQVRVPVMEWGFNSPLAHDETADPFGICGFCFPWLLLVAPLVFRAPSGPAPREIATREPKGSEWSISKPARALRSLRHPPYRRRLRCWCVAWCVVSMPGQTLSPPTGTAARPRHRPSISHVIPLRLVQTLNLRRWNCNVFGVSRKMTAINYVRNMGGGDVLAPVGTTARPRASKRSLSSVSHAIP